MIVNYLTIALRSLSKRKFHAAVNVFGLSVGVAFALLAASFIWDEYQVNAGLKNIDNQYLVRSNWRQPGMGADFTTSSMLVKKLQETHPDLAASYYRFDGITCLVSNGEKKAQEGVQAGDSTLLTMYGFRLLHGDAATALRSANALVLTRKKALEYFGTTNAVGKTLSVASFTGKKQDFTVTGVLDELPRNSVTQLIKAVDSEIFMSAESLPFIGRGSLDNWNSIYIAAYVELKSGVSKEQAERALAQVIAADAPDNIRSALQVYLTPLREFYWESDNGVARKMVRTLALTAAFMLLMALVNFVNLMIGYSSTRLREIAVRKVLGGVKRQIIAQFLVESLVLSSLAVLFALVLYLLFRPFAADLLGRELRPFSAFPPAFALVPAGLALFAGLSAGFYPAFVLSRSGMVSSLKGNFQSVTGGLLFRRALMTTQFSIALFVGCGALIVGRQVAYFFNTDLGYDKESVITVRLPRDFSPEGVRKMETFRDELAQLPAVKSAAFSFEIPDGNYGFSSRVRRAEQDSTFEKPCITLQTDEKFAETYQIPLSAGKFFHDGQSVYNDQNVVLNEAAAQSLGFRNAEEAVGRQIKIAPGQELYTVTGVCRDFHFESMYETVKPMLFLHTRLTNQYRYMSFKLKPGSLAESVAAVEHKFRELMPDAPFACKFMDDSLQKMYESELQLKKASRLATILALLIVLLGVFGAVSLSLARRNREMNIRKVLGAGAGAIVGLFYREFLLVLLLSFVLSAPVAYVAMRGWLNNYAYRIEIGWAPFVWVWAIVALLIGLLVAGQTLKTALSNPVKALRNE